LQSSSFTAANDDNVANTHSHSKITHSQQIAYGGILQKQQQQQQKRHYIRGEVLQSVVNKKFENSGEREGLTYWDLYKAPQYKLVQTDTQAKDLIKHGKKGGFLHPSINRTNPQEYFSTKDQAELAYIHNNHNKKITHLYPTGVAKAFGGAAAPNTTAIGGGGVIVNLNDPDIAALEYAKYLEDLKVNATASAMYLLTSGAIPCGMHKIHIHTSLNPDFISEAYHERLSHITPNPKNNQAKELLCRIDNFFVKLYVFPNYGSVDIYIPCTRRPFPIDINDPDTTTANILCFAGAIRHFLANDSLHDYSGRIVPKLQDWWLLRADINFDIRCSVTKYSITSDIQMTKFGGIFRIYGKMIDGKTHIRFEQDKVFGGENAPLDNSIGSTIVAAAREAQKELSMRGGV
jgi:hypothetical protein